MSGGNEELLAGLATAPWQPQSLRARKQDSLPRRLRLGLLAAVALLHALAALALLTLVERNREATPADAIVVDFINAPDPPPLPDETMTIRMPPETARALPATPTGPQEATPPPRDRPEVPMRAVEAPRPLQLYNPDGSLRLPEDMMDRLDREFGDKRQFSYQVPGLDDAKKYFDRNPALVYEETRFEQYWTPDEDALTSVLRKAVEATTKQVKVKVPGTAGSYVVCTVSILAMGGGCGVLTNGSAWNGPQDDPATLNPEEARQCAAWWEQLVGARTQEAWRITRQLYERECRKPLLRAPAG